MNKVLHGSTVVAALIDGSEVHASEAFDDLDPSSGTRCAVVTRCDLHEVDAAVDSARSTYERVWRNTSAAERAGTCREMAKVLRAQRAELAELETLDTGKPLSQARTDVDVAARYFDFYGGTVEALYGETVLSEPGVVAYTLLEPHGVCGHIIPWNYPLQVAARTIAPALAAGNCCVLKPSEDAPLTALRLGQLALDAGFPDGALNVVPGLGDEAGAALAANNGIDHLAFTGSREVGRLVMTSAATNVVPVTLELGGKSPHIVLPDFEPTLAIPLIVHSITENAGQNCSAGSRLLVHESVHNEVRDLLAGAFDALTIGPGILDPDVGPLISERQRVRVLEYIEAGIRESALVVGGGVPADKELANGFFVRPTIFDNVSPDAVIAQEEIFGPVLAVTAFRDLDEAVELANGTSYGLSAGVWTNSVGNAHWLTRELQVSQVFVNNYSAAGGVELPFGGCKRSGFGREKGFAALREYSRIKAVAVRATPRADGIAGRP